MSITKEITIERLTALLLRAQPHVGFASAFSLSEADLKNATVLYNELVDVLGVGDKMGEDDI